MSACSFLAVTSALPLSCHQVVVGSVGVGAPCAHPHECKPGLTCNGHTATTEGVCTAPAGHNEKCPGPSAKPGEAPSSDLSLGDHPPCQGYCADDKCHRLNTEGASCSLGGNPGWCSPELACAQISDNKRACMASDGKLGSPCQPGSCAAGLGCNLGTCVEPIAAGNKCTSYGDGCAGQCTNINQTGFGTCRAQCGSK